MTVTGGPPAPAVDPLVWARVKDSAAAARSRSRTEFAAAMRRFADELSLPQQRLGGIYVLFMLREAVSSRYGRTPTAEEITVVAREVEPFYEPLSLGTLDDVEAVLLSAFGLAGSDREMTGPAFTLQAAAVLGQFLSSDASQLDAILPHLEQWCAREAGGLADITND